MAIRPYATLVVVNYSLPKSNHPAYGQNKKETQALRPLFLLNS